jgi:hypothetical protein
VLLGGALVHPTNISLRDVSGTVAWEFAGEPQKTIIYGREDVRALYDLDAAYRPYGIDGKLVFVGEDDGLRFVMVDEKRLGPEFDEIIVAYCCEPAAYSVRFGEGRYAFWGSRGDRHYIVEAEGAALSAPGLQPAVPHHGWPSRSCRGDLQGFRFSIPDCGEGRWSGDRVTPRAPGQGLAVIQQCRGMLSQNLDQPWPRIELVHELRHSMKLASSDAKETERKPDKRTDVVQMGLSRLPVEERITVGATICVRAGSFHRPSPTYARTRRGEAVRQLHPQQGNEGGEFAVVPLMGI